MDVLRISAFSENGSGGNPAGVVIANTLPSAADMQRVAHEVGYSETVFAAPADEGWRVRYFSPENEVPFCGHATIALGAALTLQEGDGVFGLSLNDANITVEGHREHDVLTAALQSPPTRSMSAPAGLVSETLALFGYTADDIDQNIPPALAHAGADHLIIGLKSRSALAAMRYDLVAGRSLMRQAGLVTIILAYAERASVFHTRNPFASGGVYEDPATGAASAALGGYLRDIEWPHGGAIDIIQGEDMGMRSRIKAVIPSAPASSIRISGEAHLMPAT